MADSSITCPVTPLPGLDSARPVMLVGGTFDPPHLAHTELAKQARGVVAPDAHLYFVPAARSPHKEGGPEATGEQRAAMLELAIAEILSASVWTDELDRAAAGEPSYWVVTLRRARSLIGVDRRLLFLVGADQAVSFGRWYEPDEILGLAEVVVINRGDVRTKQALADCLAGSCLRDRLVSAWCDVDHLEISATGVREALGTQKESDLRGVLCPEVASYIRSHDLYRD